MNILFFIHDDDSYGSAQSLLELVLELKRKRHNIIVINPVSNRLNKYLTNIGVKNYSTGFMLNCCTLIDNSIKHTVQFYKMKFKYILKQEYAKRKIDNLIDFSDIDIIHTNNTVIDIGVYFAKKYHKPHVWHIREFGEEDFGLKYYHDKMGKYISDNSDAVIMISDAISQSWIGKGVDAKKVVTILHGVSEKKYAKQIALRKENCLRIVFSGAIRRSKGQLDIIKAINALDVLERKNINLDFYGSVGEIEYQEEMDMYIRKNRLENVIHFKGYSDNLNEILPQYDVGIVNSLCEGMGRVTIEYMLSGLYVQASNRGANPEILLYGKLGGGTRVRKHTGYGKGNQVLHRKSWRVPPHRQSRQRVCLGALHD